MIHTPILCALSLLALMHFIRFDLKRFALVETIGLLGYSSMSMASQSSCILVLCAITAPRSSYVRGGSLSLCSGIRRCRQLMLYKGLLAKGVESREAS